MKIYLLIYVHYDYYRFEKIIAVTFQKHVAAEFSMQINSKIETLDYDEEKNTPYEIERTEKEHFWIKEIYALDSPNP